MTTRSRVNRNIVLASGLSGKLQTKPNDTQANTNPPQSSEINLNPSQPSVIGKNTENAKGPLSGSSNKQVNLSLFEPIAFDDTADLNITDSAERTINKSIVDEIFPVPSEESPEHSSSRICGNDVSLDTEAYPDTREDCITVIDTLRKRERSLRLANCVNENFLGLLQSDAKIAKKLLKNEHIKREHYEGEYYRCYQEIQRLEQEGGKNHKSIRELNELVQHLRESDVNSTSTQTLVAVQKELEAVKITRGAVEAQLATEQ